MTADHYSRVVLSRIREQRLLHDVTLELTYGCNLDCFYCYNDRDKPGEALSLAQYRTLLHDLAEMQTMYLMLTGGEPMLHPHFFAIGALTRELGFATTIRTNGHSLGARNIERMRDEIDPYKVEVSLHGANAEVHDRQTRVAGSFERLMANVAQAVSAGLRVDMVCTPTKWNQHQISEMFLLSDALGVRLRCQGPVAPRDNGDTAPLELQPSSAVWDVVRAELSSRNPLLESELEGRQSQSCSVTATCSVGVQGVDIDPYGNVQACIHLQRSAGNLHERSIKDIWTASPLFVEARDRAEQAAQGFAERPPEQYGAPIYCLAVEENAEKGCNTDTPFDELPKGVELIRLIPS